jgi:hypothetical protein
VTGTLGIIAGALAGASAARTKTSPSPSAH